MVPRNAKLPGHWSQMIKECPLCGLHVAASISKALGECRAVAHVRVSKVETEHKNGACLCLHPQRDSQQAPSLSIDILILANESPSCIV